MTSVQQPSEPDPRAEFLTPAEVLRRATSLPPMEDLVIEDVTVEEWADFESVLAEL